MTEALLSCVILLAGSCPSTLRAQQTSPCLVQAEADLNAGMLWEEDGLEGCVDLFYQAATGAWRNLEDAPNASAACPEYQAAWQIYQVSLARLISAAGRFGRLDPRGFLMVGEAHGRRVVPVRHHGFAWKPGDLCQVALASQFPSTDLQRHYRTPGLGTSLIALRRACCEEPFFPQSQVFAVTAVLRPNPRVGWPPASGGIAIPAGEPEAVLEFYNPCLYDSLRLGSAIVGLERNLSAPLAYAAQEAPRKYLQGFLDPSETDVQPKLFLMEPYQRGKIPLVFIHGLLSDPTTWLDAVNELRAEADLYRRYQFWYFRYPTGGEFLESAAALREQLLAARETFDPACEDEALGRMVFVGHSMGGLMARLQVIYSSDILWRHAARQPLDSVLTTPAMRARLERDFFFDPSPWVSRVVFIGTPHRGAGMARRLVGRFASSLARPFGSEEPLYRQLMDQNRHVFYEYLWKSPPTSIDLLEPDNPLLRALQQMPFRCGVRLNSVIGTGGTAVLSEPGDGVVPVSSARLAGVCSELFVPARHTELHRDPATIAELKRILREHAWDCRNRVALGDG